MKAIYRTLFGWMAAAAVLLTPSCKDEFIDPYATDDEMVTVTFTVATQSDESGTRAKQDDETPDGGGTSASEKTTHISDGKKADLLIYAVYDQDYNLLTSYGMSEEKKKYFVENGFSPGEGQTFIEVKKFPVDDEISIRLLRGKTYHIAFWAQSSECHTYNTQDLKKVEMIYGVDDKTTDADKEISGVNEGTTDEGLKVSGNPNNDEMRDAFCNVATVSSDVQRHETVTLYRPLAQINVGTSGYDFEIATRGTHSPKYRYSKIEIIRAARYLNVVEDKIVTSTTTTPSADGSMSTETLASLTYDWAPIPAYYETEVPDDPSKPVTDEEYLKVNLNHDEVLAGYVSLEDYNANLANPNLTVEQRKDANYTETFKYLSMCYILVPVQGNNEKNTDLPGKEEDYKGGGDYTTTLDKVKVYLAEDLNGKSENTIVELSNVPVHRNWRTNIISQELLTAAQTLEVNLEPMYAGDYNTDDFGKTWSGPLAKDVYYDAIADEILISGKDGLIWLQRMVNGKYEYPIDGGGSFSDDGINEPADKALRDRIMRATHQEWNSNSGGDPEKGGARWPEHNNFHFMYYTNSTRAVTSRLPDEVKPAKVRLTVDIDMSDVEWIPIGWANNTAETFDIFQETSPDMVAFCGEFDGGDHTIYNLKNKRFTASVANVEGVVQTSNTGPYDKAIQWFSVGFFGQIGQSGSVSNLRLSQVDLLGYCHVGGIVGTLTGPDAYVRNCYVDGGSIVASPMYRGDVHRQNDGDKKGRTFARGIFAGGIVGYLNIGRRSTAKNVWKGHDEYKYCGSITDCKVRNLSLRAYRQIGGIAGAINIYDRTGEDKANDGSSRCVREISGCNISNVTIIADKFQPYDVFFNEAEKVAENNYYYKNAFGWVKEQLALSGSVVGGDIVTTGNTSFLNDKDNFPETGLLNNSENDVIITEFATGISDEFPRPRKASIQQIPLNLMPMLSSWFCDEVTLLSDFSGTPSARKQYGTSTIAIDSRKPGENEILVPFNIPEELSVKWESESGKVGVYVEGITLDGASDGRSRSTIVVEDVYEEDNSALYVGARWRDREWLKISPDNGIGNNGFVNAPEEDGKTAALKAWQNATTTIKNLAVRGNPYAYTGICLAPNKNVAEIVLENLAVYDVYKTIELNPRGDEKTATTEADKMQLRTPVKSKLTVKNSNLRGYTTPGKNWKQITFENTTFERGAQTGQGNSDDAKTYVVEKTSDPDTGTTFTKCWFKAPYIIEIAKDAKVTFEGTYATAATTDKIKIKQPDGCTKIIIGDDGFGKVTVKYEPESPQE